MLANAEAEQAEGQANVSRKINDGLSNSERYRRRQRRKGLCLDCPRPAAPGRVRCTEHLKRDHRHYAKKKGSAIGKAGAKKQQGEVKTRRARHG